MATEEEESDVSLKEIVQQTLEARGLFASIRAQLMASVFEVYTKYATHICVGELCEAIFIARCWLLKKHSKKYLENNFS